jgi:hypothetical protein
MNYYPLQKGLLWALCLITTLNTYAQQRTVGLTKYQEPNHQKGYYLLSPMVNQSKNTYLLDDCGRVVKTWEGGGMPGTACILGHDGSLIRTNSVFNPYMAIGSGGVIEKFDWTGSRIWRWVLTDSNESLHHDITELPNGNILAIVWVRKTAAEAEALGRTFPLGRTDILFERIIEIQPKDTNDADIVWEWRLWDHLVQNTNPSKPGYGTPSQHPELLDINYYEPSDIGRDWLHLNGIDYNPTLDQIVITSRSLGEFYVIDHSTNVIEASGHSGGRWGKGGDFLYRWGNPEAYGRGTPQEKRLYVPHHAHWIKEGLPHAGKFLIFNNGQARPDGTYSSVDMVTPPLDNNFKYTIQPGKAYLPASGTQRYKAAIPTSFYSAVVCGSYMLKNGNLLTTDGLKGKAFESDSAGNIVWTYINPYGSAGIANQGDDPGINTVFRYEYYAPDFSGFTGKNLTPGSELEKNPYAQRLCEKSNTGLLSNGMKNGMISPNPAGDFAFISAETVDNGKIYNTAGRCAGTFSGNRIDLRRFKPGIWVVSYTAEGKIHTERLLKTE